MDVRLDKTNPTEGRLVVSVVEADYAQKVTDELKKIGRTHVLPGFRKGAVPANILRKRFGKEVTSDVINHVVYEAVVKYIQDEKLNILGEPLPVDVKELDLVNQKDYTFEYEVGFGPELDITLDKTVNMPYYRIEVTDEMVKEQDTALTQRFGTQEAQETFSGRALLKGSLKEVGKEDGISVESTIVGPFVFKNEDQKAKFEGAKVGDTVVFNPFEANGGEVADLAAMLQVDKDKAAEAKGDFEFTVAEITGIKPAEHGEEFFKQVFGQECTTEEQYMENVKKMIESQLLPNSAGLFEQQSRKMLLEQYGSFELPGNFLKKWFMARNSEIKAENVDKEYEESIPSLKWELISGAIARKLDVKVTEEDMLQFAKHVAARQLMQYGMTNIDESFVEQYAQSLTKDQKQRQFLAEQVSRANLFDAIGKAVTIEDKTVSLDEFKQIAQSL
jgi:trigger factor